MGEAATGRRRVARTARRRAGAALGSVVLVVGSAVLAPTSAHATSATEVEWAFTTGGSLTLTSDVTLTDPLILSAGTTLTIDLAGHRLRVNSPSASAGLANRGTLTVRNGALEVNGGHAGAGAAGADGPHGTESGESGGPDGTGHAESGGDAGRGGNGGRGTDALHNGPTGVLTLLDVDLRLLGGAGGDGGRGGRGGHGADAVLTENHAGHGGDGAAGGSGGDGGTALRNNGMVAVVGGSMFVSGGHGGHGGNGGAGGDGGNAVGAAAITAGDGGDAGNGGRGGNGGTGVDNDGTLLTADLAPVVVAASPGRGGAAGEPGETGLGAPDVNRGSVGTDGATGADGVIWAGAHPNDVTLFGAGADGPAAVEVRTGTIGDALDALSHLPAPWPTRPGHTFDGWSAAPSGDEPVDRDDAVAGQTIYATWSACDDPDVLASWLAAAEDGGTVTLCGDVVVDPATTTLVVGDGRSVTLDLDGHALEVNGPADTPGLVVEEGSSLTVTDSSADGTGEFRNGGTVTVDGTLDVDAPATSTGVVTGAGRLTGDGTFANDGAVRHSVVVDPDLTVTGHSYLLTLDPDGGAVTPGSVHVHAPTLADAGLATDDLPEPTRDGHVFEGWRLVEGTGEDQVTLRGATDPDELLGADDVLSTATSTDGTPVPVTLQAVWTVPAEPSAPVEPGEEPEQPAPAPADPPTEVDEPADEPAEDDSPGTGPVLADTGADLRTALSGALVLLVAGAALVLAGRRPDAERA